MFADYRVPVVLRQLGILQYSSQLTSKVTNSRSVTLALTLSMWCALLALSACVLPHAYNVSPFTPHQFVYTSHLVPFQFCM